MPLQTGRQGMKNQFVGDLNDYYKYGLLRVLSGCGEKEIGVCWMLTPNGGKIGYLQKPSEWRTYDKDVFDALKKIVLEDKTRHVKKIEKVGILPPSCKFFGGEKHVENNLGQRGDYFNEMLQKLSGVDLIFFDPDVGLVPPRAASKPQRQNKWLYYDELGKAYAKGHSILVIQFWIGRKLAAVKQKIRQIRKVTGCPEVRSFLAGNVEFFLVPQQTECNYFSQRAIAVKERWGDRIKVTLYRPRGADIVL